MSLADIIKARAKPVTITRSSGVTTVNGYRVPSAPVVINQDVYMQSMSRKDLRDVPEGQNTMEWMNVYSELEVKNKDVIAFNTVNYTVQDIAYRPEGPFYRGTAVKVNDAP